MGTGITEEKVKKFNCTIKLQFTHIYKTFDIHRVQ